MISTTQGLTRQPPFPFTFAVLRKWIKSCQWRYDQTTRHLPQHENGLSCWHIKLIAHSFFHFDSRAISTAKGSFLSIGMILWYTRNNCLFLVMDSLEQSGHGTRSIWCVANGRICYSVLFFSANGDDYGICVTIARNWMHFGECIVKPTTE